MGKFAIWICTHKKQGQRVAEIYRSYLECLGGDNIRQFEALPSVVMGLYGCGDCQKITANQCGTWGSGIPFFRDFINSNLALFTKAVLGTMDTALTEYKNYEHNVDPEGAHVKAGPTLQTHILATILQLRKQRKD